MRQVSKALHTNPIKHVDHTYQFVEFAAQINQRLDIIYKTPGAKFFASDIRNSVKKLTDIANLQCDQSERIDQTAAILLKLRQLKDKARKQGASKVDIQWLDGHIEHLLIMEGRRKEQLLIFEEDLAEAWHEFATLEKTAKSIGR